MTKGAVKFRVKDDNSLSPGTVTQKALRKNNSKTMADSVVNSHILIMPWHAETIRPKMQSVVHRKPSKHICCISSCHSLETHPGTVVRTSVSRGSSIVMAPEDSPSNSVANQNLPTAFKIHDQGVEET